MMHYITRDETDCFNCELKCRSQNKQCEKYDTDLHIRNVIYIYKASLSRVALVDRNFSNILH